MASQGGTWTQPERPMTTSANKSILLRLIIMKGSCIRRIAAASKNAMHIGPSCELEPVHRASRYQGRFAGLIVFHAKKSIPVAAFLIGGPEIWANPANSTILLRFAFSPEPQWKEFL